MLQDNAPAQETHELVGFGVLPGRCVASGQEISILPTRRTRF